MSRFSLINKKRSFSKKVTFRYQLSHFGCPNFMNLTCSFTIPSYPKSAGIEISNYSAKVNFRIFENPCCVRSALRFHLRHSPGYLWYPRTRGKWMMLVNSSLGAAAALTQKQLSLGKSFRFKTSEDVASRQYLVICWQGAGRASKQYVEGCLNWWTTVFKPVWQSQIDLLGNFVRRWPWIKSNLSNHINFKAFIN